MSLSAIAPDGVVDSPREPLRSRVPWLYYGLVAAALAVLVSVFWLVHLARRAGDQLGAVRVDVAQLRTSTEAPSGQRIVELEADLRRRTALVHGETDNPLWRLAEHVPDFGSDFTVAARMADITDQLAQNVLPPLADSSHGLSLSALRAPDGSIRLDDLTRISAATASALPALANARHELAQLDQRVHVNALAHARDQFAVELAGIQTSLGTADEALQLLPPMLGRDRPRDYFLVFQNLAEARGTGGLMGTWGILHAASGKLTLTRTGSDDELQRAASLAPAAVEPGDGFDDTWGPLNPLSDYAVANLAPSFAAAGQLFAEHASQQLGLHIDGVIAVNARTLGTLLGSRSVTLGDGTVVNARNVLRVTGSDLYNRYGEASPVRKQLLAQLAKDAFDTIGRASAPGLLTGLRRSIAAGDLQLWSSDPAQERILATTDLGGIMPAVAGSFAYLAVNNTGPKTDLFLSRSVTYSTDACPAPDDPDQTRSSSIVVSLTDRVPAGEAPVISRDEDDPTAPYGRGHDYVSVYGPVGAVYTDATLNGRPVDVSTSTEQGHLVMSVDLLEPDGVPQVLEFHLVEPVSHSLLHWRAQPMAQPETVVEHYSPC